MYTDQPHADATGSTPERPIFTSFNKDFIMTSTSHDSAGDDWTNFIDTAGYKPRPPAANALRAMAGLPETSRARVSVDWFKSASGDGYAIDESLETLTVYVGGKEVLDLEGYDITERFFARLNHAHIDLAAKAQAIIDIPLEEDWRHSAWVAFDDGTVEEYNITTPLGTGETHGLKTTGPGRIIVDVELQDWCTLENTPA